LWFRLANFEKGKIDNLVSSSWERPWFILQHSGTCGQSLLKSASSSKSKGWKVGLVGVWCLSIPREIVCGMLKLPIDFCFKAWEAIQVISSATLESSFVILCDYDTIVTTACSLRNITTALAMLVILTPPNAVWLLNP